MQIIFLTLSVFESLYTFTDSKLEHQNKNHWVDWVRWGSSVAQYIDKRRQTDSSAVVRRLTHIARSRRSKYFILVESSTTIDTTRRDALSRTSYKNGQL